MDKLPETLRYIDRALGTLASLSERDAIDHLMIRYLNKAKAALHERPADLKTAHFYLRLTRDLSRQSR